MGDAPENRKRTPIPTLLVRVTRMFLRPAMFGWTLKAFALIVMLLVPLAVVSAYGSTPPESRKWLFGSAVGMFAAAYGLHRLGKWMRGD